MTKTSIETQALIFFWTCLFVFIFMSIPIHCHRKKEQPIDSKVYKVKTLTDEEGKKYMAIQKEGILYELYENF